MSHDFILTDEDAAPAGATHAQDVLELSILTMQQQAPSSVDICWGKSPLEHVRSNDAARQVSFAEGKTEAGPNPLRTVLAALWL